jgi:hypothetical protein
MGGHISFDSKWHNILSEIIRPIFLDGSELRYFGDALEPQSCAALESETQLSALGSLIRETILMLTTDFVHSPEVDPLCCKYNSSKSANPPIGKLQTPDKLVQSEPVVAAAPLKLNTEELSSTEKKVLREELKRGSTVKGKRSVKQKMSQPKRVQAAIISVLPAGRRGVQRSCNPNGSDISNYRERQEVIRDEGPNKYSIWGKNKSKLGSQLQKPNQSPQVGNERGGRPKLVRSALLMSRNNLNQHYPPYVLEQNRQCSGMKFVDGYFSVIPPCLGSVRKFH